MSHWYLANLIEFSKLDGVDLSVTEDVETLLKEFGLKDVAEWDALGFEGQRKFHERFAYQAEVYLSTGHAPTRSLERFFARFASWIKSVYLQWSGDARAALSAAYQVEFGEDLPDISPDMKRVFDRMLVAQRDLDLAESANGLKPLFDEKPEDMPEDQWRELMAARDEATARGEAKLLRHKLRTRSGMSMLGCGVLAVLIVKRKIIATELRKKFVLVSMPEKNSRHSMPLNQVARFLVLRT